MAMKATTSIVELEKALAARKKALVRLKKARAKVETDLKRLDGKITELLGKPTAVRRKRRVKKAKTKKVVSRRKPGGKPGAKGTLRDAVLKVLAKAEQPMGVKEIAAVAIEAGYRTKSKDLSKSVIPIVYRDPRIKKVGRGKFVLK